MDVYPFLEFRLTHLEYYYRTAVRPFEEIIVQIENELPPFDEPPYSEDGEPAFMEEWQAAALGIELLGRNCISNLAGNLQLTLDTWMNLLPVKIEPEKGSRPNWRQKVEALAIHCNAGNVLSEVDLDLLEQVVLVRNRDQHQDQITMDMIRFRQRDLERHPETIFLDPAYAGMGRMNLNKIKISEETLLRSIQEARRFWKDVEEPFQRFRWSPYQR